MNAQKPYRRVLGKNPTPWQVVEYISSIPGVIASVIYLHKDLGHVKAGSCTDQPMDLDVAYNTVRDLRSLMISAHAKSADLVIDNSIRVVARIVDPCQLLAIGVFVIPGSTVNKSLQRTISTVVKICNPGGQ